MMKYLIVKCKLGEKDFLSMFLKDVYISAA